MRRPGTCSQPKRRDRTLTVGSNRSADPSGRVHNGVTLPDSQKPERHLDAQVEPAGSFPVSQETAELRYIGDGMQSAASRMAEWIRNVGSKVHGRELPYEVYMAALEAEDYVAQWTDARIGYATSNPTDSTGGSE